MKSTTRQIALTTALMASFAGCEGLHVANLAVLGVTFGLFFGTLNLGRKAPTDSAAVRATGSATRTTSPLAK